MQFQLTSCKLRPMFALSPFDKAAGELCVFEAYPQRDLHTHIQERLSNADN